MSPQTALPLPGMPPRPSETDAGRELLELRARFGWAWVLKHAPQIQEGERLARPDVIPFRPADC